MASLAPNALVGLQTVKDWLSITNTLTDALLTGVINQVSSQVEEHCQRTFRLSYYGADYYATPSSKPLRTVLNQAPVASLQLVTEFTDTSPGQQVLIADYELEDAFAGWIYRWNRWQNTATRRPDIVQDYQPRSELASLLVQYVAGYITQPQALAASAWSSLTPVLPGALTLGAGTGDLWMAVMPSGQLTGTTGSVKPTFAGTAASTIQMQGLSTGTTVADGSGSTAFAWAYMGTVGADGYGAEGTAATLPQELLAAVVDTVAYRWRNRGKDTSVKSESLAGMASVSYGDRGLFPPGALPVFDRFRMLKTE